MSCAGDTAAVFEKIKHLNAASTPSQIFRNSRMAAGGPVLAAEKMKECVWLKPEAVAQIAFLEWTGADHLSHTKIRYAPR